MMRMLPPLTMPSALWSEKEGLMADVKTRQWLAQWAYPDDPEAQAKDLARSDDEVRADLDHAFRLTLNDLQSRRHERD
jgi:hypothetical protein